MRDDSRHTPYDFFATEKHRNRILRPELRMPSVSHRQKRLNRHRKHLLHLVQVRFQQCRTVVPNRTHHRRYGRSKVRHQLVTATPRLYPVPWYTNFLLGFAGRTRLEVGVRQVPNATYNIDN